jgi:hypothetical protein
VRVPALLLPSSLVSPSSAEDLTPWPETVFLDIAKIDTAMPDIN